MALEAYLIDSVRFDDNGLVDALVFTLYEPDSAEPRGSITVPQPPPVGTRAAVLMRGRREGKVWEVTLQGIEIYNRTAVGCEFLIFGPTQRTVVGELTDKGDTKPVQRIENLGATF